MAYIRRNTSDDATWQRAWTADTLTDLATISAILGSERPHHGDIAYVTANSNYYLWLDNGSWAQISGLGAGSTSQSIILGMDGIDGNDGFTIPGATGAMGATGATGAAGASGLQGPPGFDGEDTSYFGPIGNPSSPIDLAFGSRGALPTLFDISAAGGGQIKFPSTPNPSSNANTLDDYEEGTWTPVIIPDTGSGITYGTQLGAYIKVGQIVVVFARVQLTSIGSAAGSCTFGGLPFTVLNSQGARAGLTIAGFEGFSINVVWVTGRVIENSTGGFFSRLTGAASTTTSLTMAEFSSSGDITWSITYRASS